MKKAIYFAVFAVIIGVALLAYLTYLEGLKPGRFDSFAKCLSEKGFIMAGTDWCNFCQQQKALFGNSFKFVSYKNCDFEKQWCSEKGVGGYPTWFDAASKRFEGVQSLSRLSELSGCELSE